MDGTKEDGDGAVGGAGDSKEARWPSRN